MSNMTSQTVTNLMVVGPRELDLPLLLLGQAGIGCLTSCRKRNKISSHVFVALPRLASWEEL
eukprot:1739309-Amphidinium_carterae.1